MTRHEAPPPVSPELEELLGKAQPRLEEVCRKYCLTPEEASRVIYEHTVELVRRWRGISGDKEAWLLAAVERACERPASSQGAETEEN